MLVLLGLILDDNKIRSHKQGILLSCIWCLKSPISFHQLNVICPKPLPVQREFKVFLLELPCPLSIRGEQRFWSLPHHSTFREGPTGPLCTVHTALLMTNPHLVSAKSQLSQVTLLPLSSGSSQPPGKPVPLACFPPNFPSTISFMTIPSMNLYFFFFLFYGFGYDSYLFILIKG